MMISHSFAIFMTTMLLLHHPLAALNWQAIGELSDDNITIIWNFIHQNFKQNVDADTIQDFNTALSDDLNDRWATAWNVFTVQITGSGGGYNDVILCGYAFRNHWMWYNGYTEPLIAEQTFSFVIWKDYNCQGWKSIGTNAADSDQSTGFSQLQTYYLKNWITSLFNEDNLLNDPWGAAKSFVDAVQGSSNFVNDNDHAFSMVLSQPYANIYARVCVVGSNFFYGLQDYGANLVTTTENYGNFILFQTR